MSQSEIASLIAEPTTEAAKWGHTLKSDELKAKRAVIAKTSTADLKQLLTYSDDEGENSNMTEKLVSGGAIPDLSKLLKIDAEDMRVEGYNAGNLMSDSTGLKGTRYVLVDGTVYEVVEASSSGGYGLKSVTGEDPVTYYTSGYEGN
jgi:hypothetical protein